jgi:hypothetical protein
MFYRPDITRLLSIVVGLTGLLAGTGLGCRCGLVHPLAPGHSWRAGDD